MSYDSLDALLDRALRLTAEGQLAYCNSSCKAWPWSVTRVAMDNRTGPRAFFDDHLVIHIHKPVVVEADNKPGGHNCLAILNAVKQIAAAKDCCGDKDHCKCHWRLITGREIAREALKQ